MADITVKCDSTETRHDKKKSYTVYVFSVSTAAGTVLIYRRYSEIRSLYNKLKAKGVEGLPGSFPKKNYLKRMSPETIAQRVNGFTTFFTELLALPDVLIHHAEVRDFLSLRTLVGQSGESGSDRAADVSAVIQNTQSSGSKLVQGRAMYDFAASRDGEMDLVVGDIVVIDSEYEPSAPWWEGKIGSRSGRFPANHVSLIGSGAAYDTGAEPPPIPPYMSEELRVKRLTMIDAQRKLSSAEGAFGGPMGAPPPSSSSLSPASPSGGSDGSGTGAPSRPASRPIRGPPVLKTVIAIHEYEGDPETDISFIKGDTIDVLEIDDETGWWYGRLHGEEGLFPSTFVKDA